METCDNASEKTDEQNALPSLNLQSQFDNMDKPESFSCLFTLFTQETKADCDLMEGKIKISENERRRQSDVTKADTSHLSICVDSRKESLVSGSEAYLSSIALAYNLSESANYLNLNEDDLVFSNSSNMRMSKDKADNLITLSDIEYGANNLTENQRRPKKCCLCIRTKCSKMYCDCLKKGVYCSNCNCEDCLNREERENKDKCDFLKRKAFNKDLKLNTVNPYHQHKGCNCKSTNCNKNYCGCFLNKQACGELCKCINCMNDLM